jgi:hypothetical protein
VKTVLKQERFLNIVRTNLKVAIGHALQEITIHDLKEFCENNFQQYSVLGCIGVKKCDRLPSAEEKILTRTSPIKTMNGTIINHYQVSRL